MVMSVETRCTTTLTVTITVTITIQHFFISVPIGEPSGLSKCKTDTSLDKSKFRTNSVEGWGGTVEALSLK